MKPRYRVPAISQRVPASAGVSVTDAPRAALDLEAGRMARRLSNWVPSRSHINTLVNQSGKTVVARSRYLVRNNSYAAAAVECFASNLIGNGITGAWGNEDVRALWEDWIKECDAEGLTDFHGLERRVAREMFAAGECFIRRRPRFMRDGLTVPMQIELLPSEQLPVERNLFLDNGNRVRQGIEFNQLGQRVAYHFWKVHPGDVTKSQDFGKLTIIPADDVVHVFDPIESGQIRGLPRMTPSIVALWMLDAYDDAELDRKKTAALFSVFIKRVNPNPTFLDKAVERSADAVDGDVTIDLQPGVAHQLVEGEDVTVAAPADVGPGYEVFQYRNLTRYCAAVGLPYSGVTGDVGKANYGSQRAAMLEMRRRMEALQQHVMIFQMCRTVATWFLDAAVLSGAVSLKGYGLDPKPARNDVTWISPRWDWIDPLKDRQAEVLAVDAGFKARSQVVREEGWDPVEVDETIAEDQKRAKDLGIMLQGTATLNKEIAAPPPGAGGGPATQPDNAATARALDAMWKEMQMFGAVLHAHQDIAERMRSQDREMQTEARVIMLDGLSSQFSGLSQHWSDLIEAHGDKLEHSITERLFAELRVMAAEVGKQGAELRALVQEIAAHRDPPQPVNLSVNIEPPASRKVITATRGVDGNLTAVVEEQPNG